MSASVLTVRLGVAHPPGYVPTVGEMREAFAEEFNNEIAGRVFSVTGLEVGRAWSQLELSAPWDGPTPDDTEMVTELHKVLRLTVWRLNGWECWYIGLDRRNC